MLVREGIFMMNLENDLELLEEYLDGALEKSQEAKLRDRLAADKQLSSTLAALQSQRALRQAAFATMEPTEVSAQQLVWRVRGAMLNQQRAAVVQPNRQWNQWRIASIGSTAAACMVLGFFFGRLGHTGNTVMPPSNTTPMTMIADRATPKISVPITNEYGQVVAWQTFDNADQAKSFTEDFHRTHGQTQQPAGVGQTRLVDQQVQMPF
jgi:hypothetical protein